MSQHAGRLPFPRADRDGNADHGLFSGSAEYSQRRADYRGTSAGSRQQRNRRQVMIIDVHGHLGEDVVFDEQQTEEQLLDAYKKNGVDGAIIQHICQNLYGRPCTDP